MNRTRINRLELSALRNDAHFQLHTEVAKLIAEITAALLHIVDLAPLHASLLAALDVVLKNIPKSPITEQLQEADKARDETFRGLVFFIKAMCLHFTTATRAAARRVRIVVDTYGNVTVKSYEEESSAVYNLVQDLKSDKYAADVAAIGLTPWVEALNTQNNLFMTLLESRDNEYAAKSHVAVKDARHALDEVYRDIVGRVDTHHADANVTLFITKLNIIVKRFKALIPKDSKGGHDHSHHHSGGNTAGEETETEE